MYRSVMLVSFLVACWVVEADAQLENALCQLTADKVADFVRDPNENKIEGHLEIIRQGKFFQHAYPLKTELSPGPFSETQTIRGLSETETGALAVAAVTDPFCSTCAQEEIERAATKANNLTKRFAVKNKLPSVSRLLLAAFKIRENF